MNHYYLEKPWNLDLAWHIHFGLIYKQLVCHLSIGDMEHALWAGLCCPPSRKSLGTPVYL